MAGLGLIGWVILEVSRGAIACRVHSVAPGETGGAIGDIIDIT